MSARKKFSRPLEYLPEAVLATAVPEPIAIPISAFFNAGASFTPSPVMAVTSPFFCKYSTIFDLCDGSTRAKSFAYKIYCELKKNETMGTLSKFVVFKHFLKYIFKRKIIIGKILNLLSPSIQHSFVPSAKGHQIPVQYMQYQWYPPPL